MNILINNVNSCSLEEHKISNTVYVDNTDNSSDSNIVNNNPKLWLIDIINIEKQKEQRSNIWNDSIYKVVTELESNNVGNVGEKIIHKICIESKIISSIDGTKTKQIGGGKEGDGKINNKSVEVKTARMGSTSPSFQHELGEHPWNADYMIFVDISPINVYVTIFKNFTEEQYKKKAFKCAPYFPTKSITQRKGMGNFKLDTSININEICIKNCFSINLKNVNIKEIGAFINKTII